MQKKLEQRIEQRQQGTGFLGSVFVLGLLGLGLVGVLFFLRGAAESESGQQATQYAGEALSQASEAIRGQAESLGSSVTQRTSTTVQSTQQGVTDAGVTAKVKLVLTMDPLVQNKSLEVGTQDGVVTVEGLVKSEAARQRVLDNVRSVQGVTEVVDELVVKE